MFWGVGAVLACSRAASLDFQGQFKVSQQIEKLELPDYDADRPF
jgi:hypothetical protein